VPHRPDGVAAALAYLRGGGEETARA